MKVDVEYSLFEGYSDQQGPGSADVRKEFDLTEIPRIGDYVDVGYGDSAATSVYWNLDEARVTIHCRRSYTTSDVFGPVVDGLRKKGWTCWVRGENR